MLLLLLLLLLLILVVNSLYISVFGSWLHITLNASKHVAWQHDEMVRTGFPRKQQHIGSRAKIITF